MNPTAQRVQQLRELKGFTQASLAELACISQPTVARIENGESVSDDSLSAVADALDVPPILLERPIPARFTGSTVRFRAHASLRSWERYRAHRWGEIAYEVFTHLRASVKLPQRALLQNVSADSPQRAAALAREVLGLPADEPIPNLTRTLERAGIRMFLLPLVGDVHAGYSLFEGRHEPEPLICLFRDVPADKARFTLAHEVAHLVLHRSRAERQREAEDEANRFAGAFLLPEEPFLADLGELRANTLSTYLHLKPRWGVSIQAMIMRAHDLSRISDWQKRRLFSELSSRGWRTDEPIDLPEESPRQMLKALEIVYGKPPDLRRLATDIGFSELIVTQLFPDVAPDRADDAQIIPFDSARRRPEPTSGGRATRPGRAQ